MTAVEKGLLMKAKCEWCSEFKDCTAIADQPTGWTYICGECLAERKAAGIEDKELTVIESIDVKSFDLTPDGIRIRGTIPKEDEDG